MDATKLRYWTAKEQSGRQDGAGKVGASCEYTSPSATYDLRCVEQVSLVTVKEGGKDKHEFVVKYNQGLGMKTGEESEGERGRERGGENRESASWSELRLRGPVRNCETTSMLLLFLCFCLDIQWSACSLLFFVCVWRTHPVLFFLTHSFCTWILFLIVILSFCHFFVSRKRIARYTSCGWMKFHIVCILLHS